jgi:hypothetical protein
MISEPYPDDTVGPGSPYNLEQWRDQYHRLKSLADEMSQLLNDEARRMCADAGLSPDLLGIHPHNAMCGLEHGRPWEGVDYNRVRICLDLLRIEFDAHKVVTAWDEAVRGLPQERWLREQREIEDRESRAEDAA